MRCLIIFFRFFIMHYLTYVFIPRAGSIDAAVAKALAPFDEARVIEPWKEYLDAEQITLMARHYRIRRNSLKRLAEKMPLWTGSQGGVDQRGLFALRIHDPNAKWDWYEIGGRWHGQLPGNVMTARRLSRSKKLLDLLPHDFLTPDGVWHQVERYVPGPKFSLGRFIRRRPSRWLKEIQTALTKFPSARVACVDIHS